MSTVISKVKSVQANGTFESQYGADIGNGKKGFFKFDYEFEDGTSLAANHKTKETPFPVGTEVEYTIKGSNDYGAYGKVSKAQTPQDKQNRDEYVKGIEAGHAINNAVNLICAGAELDVKNVSGTAEEKIYLYAKKIHSIADRLKKEL